MILTINGGSSSIKFALYTPGSKTDKVLYGQLSKIGSPDAGLSFSQHIDDKEIASVKASSYEEAVSSLIDWLKGQAHFTEIKAIGHRVVHGMQYTEPALVTDALLADLKQITAYDPDHLPGELQLIEGFQKGHSDITQYVCFDTAFHRDMPRVAQMLPIPRRFDGMGIHRYGFHGLSYTYLMQELERSEGRDVANGRIILAHLGSGASLAAVHQGKSIDTSMGFTPGGGIPMSSRSGDLDPGVAWFMMKKEHLSADQFNHIINHESGLLGVSGISADMGELLKREPTDTHAAEAIALFCYQVKKYIGAYASVLGGLDTLVFAAGIGENAPQIRERICAGLDFLGIKLDTNSNNKNACIISSDTSRVRVHVIHTDEEIIIAQTINAIITGK